MTFRPQHTANVPATLTDEQRGRVADALENAQAEDTRRNYAGQYRKFREWCDREGQSALPAQPEVVAAYAMVHVGQSISPGTPPGVLFQGIMYSVTCLRGLFCRDH